MRRGARAPAELARGGVRSRARQHWILGFKLGAAPPRTTSSTTLSRVFEAGIEVERVLPVVTPHALEAASPVAALEAQPLRLRRLERASPRLRLGHWLRWLWQASCLPLLLGRSRECQRRLLRDREIAEVLGAAG